MISMPLTFETNSRSPMKSSRFEPWVEPRENRALTVAGIHVEHFAAVHLRRDDVALGVELHGVGNAEVSGRPSRCLPPIRMDAPDLVGAHHREVQHPIGTDFHRYGIARCRARRAARRRSDRFRASARGRATRRRTIDLDAR